MNIRNAKVMTSQVSATKSVHRDNAFSWLLQSCEFASWVLLTNSDVPENEILCVSGSSLPQKCIGPQTP